MSKHICVRESFDWVSIGNKENELTSKELHVLSKYLENNIKSDGQIIETKYNKFRFINYVGIITIGKVTIEILPKISMGNNLQLDKKLLLQMLSKCGNIELNLDQTINSKIQSYNLLELVAEQYIESLLRETNKGIYFQYVNQEENLKTLRGKLLLNQHIKHNHANRTRAYCGFSEFSCDNTLNQILKIACIKIVDKLNNHKIIGKTKKALLELSNVSFNYIDKETLQVYKLNRHNERFSRCLQFAKFILLNLSNESSTGDRNGFTMLFEMNKLYEQYIGKLVKTIWTGKGRVAKIEDDSMYLLVNRKTNRRAINLKPDITLYQDNQCIAILDSKWKAVEYKDKLDYRISDIYQMYAYVTTYQTAVRVILIYPSLNSNKDYPVWELSKDRKKSIEIKTVRLDSYQNTLNDLKELI